MNDIANYNAQIAQILHQQQALQENTIQQALSYCNAQKLNLAQVLIQRKVLPAQYVAQVIKMIHTRQGLNETHANSTSTVQEEPSKSIVKTIGKYEIISELGRGGMGVVYKVKQPGINRVLVLKTLLSNISSDPVSVKRFHKEAQMISALQHPNIIPIYDFGEENGFPYFVMQFIEGIDFQELIDKNTCERDELLQILIKVANALDHAHKNGIVHRDVKPANVFLDKNNNPYLADFGLAKMSDKSSSLTQSGAIIGTPFYLSPEQVRGHRKNIDHRSDVYALGIILYKLITGQFPFVDNQFSALYKKILQEMPTAPRKINREVSKELNFICLKTIAKNVEDRYQTAASFSQALQAYLAGEKQNIGKERMAFETKLWWNTYKKTVTAVVALCITVIAMFAWWQVAKYQTSETAQRERIYYNAYDLMRGEKYDLALQKISQIKSNTSRFTALKARIYQLTGEINKAQKLFTKALQAQDKDNEVLFLYAQFLYDTQKYQKALQYANHIVKNSRETAKYYRLRAAIYEKKQRQKFATRDRVRAKKIEDKKIAIELKQLHKYQNTNVDKALAIASQLTITFPRRAIGFRERAQIFLRKNKWDLAINDLQTAVKLEPIPKDYKNLGDIEYKIGNESQALSYYKKYDSLEKIVESGTLNKVLSLQVNLKKYLEAKETWKSITAKSAINLLQISRVYYYLQDYKNAKKFLQQIATSDEKLQTEVLYYTAITYYESGEKNKALTLLKKLFAQKNALNHEKFLVPFYLGEWEFDNKNYEAAFEYLQTAATLNGEHAQTNFLLANCHRLRKKYTKAIELYTKAIELEPWIDTYYKERAFCYISVNQKRRANDDFLHCIELDIGNLYLASYVYNNMIRQSNIFERFVLKKMLRGRVFLNYVDDKIDLFFKEKTILSRRYAQTATLQNAKQDPKNIERAQRLIDTLKTSKEKQIDDIAREGLMGMFMIQEVRDKLAQITKDKSLDNSVRQKFQAIYNDIRQQYITNQKAYFRKIISRYYMTEDNSTLLSLHSNKQINIDVLQQIMINPWEDMITRFFAGQIIVEIARNDVRNFFKTAYQSESPLTKLLINTLSMKNNLNLKFEIPQRIPADTPVFLQAKLAESLPVNHNLLKYLLQSDDAKISLPAAQKMWLAGKKTPQAILLRYCKDSRETIHAYALDTLWNLQKFPRPFQQQIVEKYTQVLVAGADHSSQKVKRVALSRMKYFTKPEFVKKLKKYAWSKETPVRLQSIFSLAIQGEITSLIPIISNPEENLALRAAPMIYFESDHKNNTPIFDIITSAQKLVQDDNPTMRSIMIEYLMRASRGRLIKFFLSHIDQNNPKSAWAMANGLIECDIEISNLLLKLCKHKHKMVRRAATMSLVHNYLRHKKIKELDALHKKLRKADKKMRTFAAFGYSFRVYHNLYSAKYFASNINNFENNNTYIKFLQKLESHFSNKKLHETSQYKMCLDRAVELDPQNDRCLLEKAIADYLLQQPQQSLQTLQKIKRENCLQQYWMAKAHLKLRNLEAAQENIKKAILSQPWNAKFLKLKSQIATQKNLDKGK
ncbi:serine/threonine-protein kinase [Candidatus Uabimicrobium amorphum]|uniref:non-specific serine/threonine protein kinase n=1 Tax=Uabimicrobium amorphum TaxID=2596890 RepID=A0A5S9IVI5_UABAM|nr:serine/threonine-protein kinase [Candidatus Uabimicrobium amorphum]BBM88061.1 protein kinase [Candidatus Uabimicrobium amorphum]